jgi:hypothetical protein
VIKANKIKKINHGYVKINTIKKEEIKKIKLQKNEFATLNI